MGGAGAAEGSTSETPSTAVEAAAAASPAASGATTAPAVATPPAPPPYVGPPPAKPTRQRVPAWAMPVLAALPLWAILYSGAFGERTVAAEGPVLVGQGVYRSAGCSGCHGATGGGGVGPALDAVVATFPSFADHVAWIENGSASVKGQPYGATGRVATGGMPGFKDSLSHAEIVAVVCHERVDFGGEELPAECAEGAAGTPASPAES